MDPSCETNPILAVPRGTGIPSASLSGQALPVSLDHWRDADAILPPDGGTTNLSETRRQLYQTNPIPGDAGSDRAWGRGAKMQNKAKLGQDGTSGGWRASEGPIMKNEPNLPIRARVGTGRGTSLAGPSLALIAPNKPNFPSSETKGKCFKGKELW